MLHYDHYYTIGRMHTICEDYALQADTPFPFLIICDGCSASQNTDVGARILALTAQRLIQENPSLLENYTLFGETLIHRAAHIIQTMELEQQALDTTLLIVYPTDTHFQVIVYGDGCILFKDKAGVSGYIDVNFTHNAPYYLSYLLNEERQYAYKQANTCPLVLNSSITGCSPNLPYQHVLVFSFPFNQFSTVGIASDGVGQFFDFQESSRIALDEVINTLLDYKNINGDYVKRRTKRVLDTYAKQAIYPADDLSIAIFTIHDV